MNRITRTRLICAALAAAVLLVALIGLPGRVDSSVGQAAWQAAPTRSPRPHSISHRSFPPGIDLLHPRPHPVSHLSQQP